MADAAVAQVAAIRLRLRRMAGVTAGVRIQAGRYRQRRAAPQSRTMTAGATILWFRVAGHVLGMIEADVEILFEAIGKALARRIVAIDVLMTDRAHRNIRRGELCQMTTGAIFVTWKIRAHRVVRSPMTARAGQRCVPGTRVQEF